MPGKCNQTHRNLFRLGMDLKKTNSQEYHPAVDGCLALQVLCYSLPDTASEASSGFTAERRAEDSTKHNVQWLEYNGLFAFHIRRFSLSLGFYRGARLRRCCQLGLNTQYSVVPGPSDKHS